MKTHLNFKSIDPKIKDAKDIIVGAGHLALYYQYKYDRRTTPLEFNTWNYQNIPINIENIDRLYYIQKRKFYNGVFNNHFEMIGRMDYETRFIYFALICLIAENRSQIRGTIYISRNPYQFIENILQNYTIINKNAILESIREEDDANHNLVTSLQNLCHDVIYKVRKLRYVSVLPKTIKEQIENYNKIKEEPLYKYRQRFIIYFWKRKHSFQYNK